jgi:diguanylate cyclase (GGDEF)-like protein
MIMRGFGIAGLLIGNVFGAAWLSWAITAFAGPGADLARLRDCFGNVRVCRAAARRKRAFYIGHTPKSADTARLSGSCCRRNLGAKRHGLRNAITWPVGLSAPGDRTGIALREQLRTQALRDPLTGLYNRRYMEDVLERYANLASRNGSPLSGVMIDLDNFKRLNDEHGHATGDAVLREVAATLISAIRPSDVACRYGGEELMVLLPDCPLADALAKAEIMRARIEALSENHGFRITASFGVAAVSETTERWTDLLSNADVALYEAKQTRRNRVAAAPRRAGGLTLAVAAG